jgi:hypothetical protein
MPNKNKLILGILTGGLIILAFLWIAKSPLFFLENVYHSAPSPSPPPTPSPENPPIHGFYGRVASIQDNSFIIKPGEGSLLKKNQVKVFVNEDTKFKKVLLFVKETTPSGPIVERKEKDISRSEIKLGDKVIVLSSENIAGKEEFLATEIRLLSSGRENMKQ